MRDDVWQARSAAFLHAFVPVRDWVARHAEAPLAEYITLAELGLANVHAVVVDRRYLGNPVASLPDDLLHPLALYLYELPCYAPELRPGDEGFARAAELHGFIAMGLPRLLKTLTGATCRTDLGVKGMKDAVAVLAGCELRRHEPAVWSDLAWRSLTAALLGRLQAVRSLGPEIEWSVLCEGLPAGLGAAFEHAGRPSGAGCGKGRSGRMVLLASRASWGLPEDGFIDAVAEDWLRLPEACTSFLTAQIAAWLCRVPQLPRNLGGDDHGAAGDV